MLGAVWRRIQGRKSSTVEGGEGELVQKRVERVVPEPPPTQNVAYITDSVFVDGKGQLLGTFDAPHVGREEDVIPFINADDRDVLFFEFHPVGGEPTPRRYVGVYVVNHPETGEKAVVLPTETGEKVILDLRPGEKVYDRSGGLMISIPLDQSQAAHNGPRGGARDHAARLS